MNAQSPEALPENELDRDARQTPTLLVRDLPGATEPPEHVKPDATLAAVVTLMLQRDYSQVPVMTSERDVKGIVTWRAIGERFSLGRPPEFARDCMVDCPIIPAAATAFSQLETLTTNECVLVRDHTRRICGIITMVDLMQLYRQGAEPFFLLSGIEMHLRTLLAARIPPEELQAARHPDDTGRKINDVTDLTWGEYNRIVEKPEMWERLKLPLDRVTFSQTLERFRQARNDIMHFRVTKVPVEVMNEMRKFLAFLHKLCQM